MIKFKEDITLGVDDLDKSGNLINPRIIFFKKNEIVEAEVIPMEDCAAYVDLKFNDGITIGMGISTDCFDIIN